jgi:hypothetical protein
VVIVLERCLILARVSTVDEGNRLGPLGDEFIAIGPWCRREAAPEAP